MFKVKKSKGNIRRKDTGRIEAEAEAEQQQQQQQQEVEVINGLNENSRDSTCTITRRPIINLQQLQRTSNPLVLSKQKKNTTTGITRPIEDYALKQNAEDEPVNIINPTAEEEKEEEDDDEDEDEDEDLVGEDYNNTKNISFGLNAVKELKLKQERIKTEQLKEGLTHINHFVDVEPEEEDDEEFLKLEHDVIRKAIGNNNNNNNYNYNYNNNYKYSFPLFDGVNYEESKQKTKLLQQLNNIQESVKSFDEYMNNLQEELDLMNSEIKRQEELLQEINYELE